MRTTRFFTYLLLLLSLSVTAQTKRALFIRLGQLQGKTWIKFNGYKDAALTQTMLKNTGFKSDVT